MNANISKEISACYAGIVGQSRIVANRILSHTAYACGDSAPANVLFTGAAGLGKTALLRADIAARKLAESVRSGADAPQGMFLKSPQEIRLANDAWFGFINAVQDGEPIVVDEFHEADQSSTVQLKKFKGIIKGLLDGGAGKVRTVRLDDETSISLPAEKVFFAVATNYPQKIKDGPAIVSRFGGETPLELYTEEELTTILLRMTAAVGLRIAENTVALIARCGRGTARPLEAMTAHLRKMATVSGKDTINREDTIAAMQSLRLYPQGVNEREVSMLVRCKGGGVTRQSLPILYNAEQKAIAGEVAFLASHHFVSVRAGTVTTTEKGNAFIDQLKREKFTLPA